MFMRRKFYLEMIRDCPKCAARFAELHGPEVPELTLSRDPETTDPAIVDAMNSATEHELAEKYKVHVETVRANKKVMLVIGHVAEQQQGKLPPGRFDVPAKKRLPE